MQPLQFGKLGRHRRDFVRGRTDQFQFRTERLSLRLSQLMKGQPELEEGIGDLPPLFDQGGGLIGNALHLNVQGLDVALDLVEEVVVGRLHERPRHGSFGLREPLFERVGILGRQVERPRSTHGHVAQAAPAQIHRVGAAVHLIGQGLGPLKLPVLPPQEDHEALRVVQLLVQDDPPQKQFEVLPPLLDEFGREASDGLLFGEGRHDGPGAFFVETFVEPEEIGVAAEDGGVGMAVVLEEGVDLGGGVGGGGARSGGGGGVVRGRAAVDAVGSVLVDAVGVDHGVGDGDVVDGVFGAEAGGQTEFGGGGRVVGRGHHGRNSGVDGLAGAGHYDWLWWIMR
mmetsp:Transcript_27135/g.57945  ORF Transcript_27135/g.57945 Transcript_27135/m.57945 type:complete len:340 (+) Transcript_27135:693-1712(+)